jgi:hypothetical protein
MNYQITATGTLKVLEDGSAVEVVYGTPEYEEFFQWISNGGVPTPPAEPNTTAPTPAEQLQSAMQQLAALTEQINSLQTQLNN